MEHRVETVKFHQLKFDDYIVGNFVKVKYTHHSPKFMNKGGEPQFLCFDDKGHALPLYRVGFRSAIGWIKEVDERIKQQRLIINLLF